MTVTSLGGIFGQLVMGPENPREKISFIPKINAVGKELIELIGVPVRERSWKIHRCSWLSNRRRKDSSKKSNHKAEGRL